MRAARPNLNAKAWRSSRVIGDRVPLLLVTLLLFACGGGDDSPTAGERLTANAGNDQTVHSGVTVTLSGSGSASGNLTYSWSQTGGSPQVVLAGGNTASPTFTAPTVTEGVTLTFRLTVTAGGQTASSTVSITVGASPAANAPPIANAGGNRTVVSCGMVTLDGSASNDPSGGTLDYSWSQTGGGPRVTLTGSDTAEVSFAAHAVTGGTTLNFELEVTNANGQTARNAVSVAVNAPEVSPTGLPNAVISAVPTSGDAPFKLTLDGWGSASGDGSCLESYAWYLEAYPYLDNAPRPGQIILPPGNHGIRLCVTDARNNVNCAYKAVTVAAGDGSAYGLDVHDDRIIIFDITELEDFFNLDAQGHLIWLLFIQHVSWALHTYFQDDFDFLIPMFNRAYENRHALGILGGDGRLGGYYVVQNSITGLGPSDYFHSSSYDYLRQYGSEGRLQGVLLFSGRFPFWYGTILHEITHRWGNYMIPVDDSKTFWEHHWGFSNAYGQLGGFDSRDLQRAPQYDNAHGDAYEIVGGRFSPYHAHHLPMETSLHRYVEVYSPMELYLMGLIPLDEVPTIRAAPDAEPVIVEHGSRHVYTVAEWEIYDKARILEEFGPRNPPHGQAQTEFKAAVVLLVSDEYPAVEQELEKLSQEIYRFSLRGDPSVAHETSFWEATGGRATMETDRLSLSRKAVPTPPHTTSRSVATFDQLRSSGHVMPPPPIMH